MQVTYIDFIETRAKCHLKKLTCNGTFRRLLICLRTPPILGFCWGGQLASESGEIQSIKLQQNMVSNRTQHPSFPPSHPLSTVLWHSEGGKSWTREKVFFIFFLNIFWGDFFIFFFILERRLEGQQYTKVGRKYQHDYVQVIGYLQSINSEEHLSQSQFLDDDILRCFLWVLSFCEERFPVV